MRYSAKQYTQALRASCRDAATCRQLIAELADTLEHLRSDPDVLSFFMSRTVVTAQQERALHDAFRDSLSDRAYAFFEALIINRQMCLLERILIGAERAADIEDRTARAFVESAVPLSTALRVRLEDALTTATGRRVCPSYVVEPAVIGGIRATVDGTVVWDGTVAGKFRRLQEHIRAATA